MRRLQSGLATQESVRPGQTAEQWGVGGGLSVALAGTSAVATLVRANPVMRANRCRVHAEDFHQALLAPQNVPFFDGLLTRDQIVSTTFEIPRVGSTALAAG